MNKTIVKLKDFNKFDPIHNTLFKFFDDLIEIKEKEKKNKIENTKIEFKNINISNNLLLTLIGIYLYSLISNAMTIDCILNELFERLFEIDYKTYYEKELKILNDIFKMIADNPKMISKKSKFKSILNEIIDPYWNTDKNININIKDVIYTINKNDTFKKFNINYDFINKYCTYIFLKINFIKIRKNIISLINTCGGKIFLGRNDKGDSVGIKNIDIDIKFINLLFKNMICHYISTYNILNFSENEIKEFIDKNITISLENNNVILINIKSCKNFCIFGYDVWIENSNNNYAISMPLRYFSTSLQINLNYPIDYKFNDKNNGIMMKIINEWIELYFSYREKYSNLCNEKSQTDAIKIEKMNINFKNLNNSTIILNKIIELYNNNEKKPFILSFTKHNFHRYEDFLHIMSLVIVKIFPFILPFNIEFNFGDTYDIYIIPTSITIYNIDSIKYNMSFIEEYNKTLSFKKNYIKDINNFKTTKYYKYPLVNTKYSYDDFIKFIANN